jgi:outer membrane protein assembly factor BamB
VYRRSVVTCALVLTAAWLLLVTQGSAATAKASLRAPSAAVDFQLNAAHTGFTSEALRVSPKHRWSVAVGGLVSYPLMVGSLIYVTAGDSSGAGTKLYAFNAATGASAWAPIELGGSSHWSGIAYEGGEIFALNNTGVLSEFNASTGSAGWTIQLPEQGTFSSAPVALGDVYTGGGGSGGTVYAVNASTGGLAWTAPLVGNEGGAPAVSATGVYVSAGCGQDYDFAPLTGELIWHRKTECFGGAGEEMQALAGKLLYARGSSFPAVINASTGKVYGPMPNAAAPLAVGATRAYILNLVNSPKLTATTRLTRSILWSFSGDGTLSTPPIVAGGVVAEGSERGNLYGLDSSNGQVLWRIDVGLPINASGISELNKPPIGLGAANGTLAVPAGEQLVVYPATP